MATTGLRVGSRAGRWPDPGDLQVDENISLRKIPGIESLSPQGTLLFVRTIVLARRFGVRHVKSPSRSTTPPSSSVIAPQIAFAIHLDSLGTLIIDRAPDRSVRARSHL